MSRDGRPQVRSSSGEFSSERILTGHRTRTVSAGSKAAQSHRERNTSTLKYRDNGGFGLHHGTTETGIKKL